MRTVGFIALVLAAGCDPIWRYHVVARNAAKAGEPVAGARFTVSCGGPYVAPCAITDMNGSAYCGGLHRWQGDVQVR